MGFLDDIAKVRVPRMSLSQPLICFTDSYVPGRYELMKHLWARVAQIFLRSGLDAFESRLHQREETAGEQ